MVYGHGSVGTRIASHANEQDFNTVLGGRDPEKVAAAAMNLGVAWRSAATSHPGNLDRLLQGIHILINAAGPFVHTSAPLMRACIRNGCHYVDLSNEIATFHDAWVLERDAREAGVSVVPGAGFGTAAVERLAVHIKGRIPYPDRLIIVRSSSGGPRTEGVRRTTRSLVAQGGATYRNGDFAQPFNKILTANLPEGQRVAVPVASGDLFAAAHTSGIPNVTVYFSSGMQPFLAKLAIPAMRQLLSAGIRPPVRQARKRTPPTTEVPARSQIWAQVTNAAGETATSVLDAGRGADLSASIAVEAVLRIRSGGQPGVLTSGEVLRPGYVSELPDVSITDQ